MPEIEVTQHESGSLVYNDRPGIAYGEAHGFRVVSPLENELFIDIDSEEQMKIFTSRLTERVRKEIGVVEWTANPSKSGLPKRHITVTLDKGWLPLERVFLQLYLGSDPTREYLSLFRIINGDPEPTLFFEKKD